MWVDLFVVGFSLCRSLPCQVVLKTHDLGNISFHIIIFIINDKSLSYWFLTTRCLCATTHGWNLSLNPIMFIMNLMWTIAGVFLCKNCLWLGFPYTERPPWAILNINDLGDAPYHILCGWYMPKIAGCREPFLY